MTSLPLRPYWWEGRRSLRDAAEAMLVELGSRRGGIVEMSELTQVFRCERTYLSRILIEVRRAYPNVAIHTHHSLGYRLTGPLPKHVERIAPK